MSSKILVDMPTQPILVDLHDGVNNAVVVTLVGARGAPGPAGVTDHGALTGLSDDDHSQYHTDARGDVRYYLKATVDTALSGKADTGHTHTGVYDPAGSAATAQSAAIATAAAALASHAALANNPHAVTKAQVGLGSVDNTADASKPISTATQSALDGKVSLASVGAINGVAPLDEGQKIPATYLPAYVDDVIEAADVAALPGTGESGRIYVTLDTGKTYRWSGSAYTEISASPGSTDAVPEGAANLYHTASRVNALISAAVGSVVQGYNATLAALAGITTTSFGRSLLELASAAAFRTAVALPTVTVAGRLARYADTAGGQGQTTAAFESAGGNFGLNTTNPTSRLHVVESTVAVTGTVYGSNIAMTVNPAAASASGGYAINVSHTVTGGANNITGNQGAMSAAATYGGSATLSALYGAVYAAHNTSTGTVTNLYGQSCEARNSSTGAVGVGIGFSSLARNLGTGTMSQCTGVSGIATNNAAGTISTATGVFGQVNVSSGTVTNSNVIQSTLSVAAGVTAPTANGLKISTANAGTITNWKGILIDAPTGAGTITSGFAIGSNANFPSFMAGALAVGSGNAPVVTLDVNGPIRVKSYTVATVPSAAVGAGQIIYVSNETGGAVLAFSDGANWHRVTDRAIIS